MHDTAGWDAYAFSGPDADCSVQVGFSRHFILLEQRPLSSIQFVYSMISFRHPVRSPGLNPSRSMRLARWYSADAAELAGLWTDTEIDTLARSIEDASQQLG
jgi:hypothetical protein